MSDEDKLYHPNTLRRIEQLENTVVAQSTQIKELEETRFTDAQLEVISPMLTRIETLEDLEKQQDNRIDEWIDNYQTLFDKSKQIHKEIRESIRILDEGQSDLRSNQKDFVKLFNNLFAFFVGYFGDKINEASLEYFKSLIDIIGCINA